MSRSGATARPSRIPWRTQGCTALAAGLWLAAAPASAAEGGGVDFTATQVPPGVLQAVRDAAQRFQERAAEWEQAVRDLVERRLYEQAAAIQAQYAVTLEEKLKREEALRIEAIRAHQAFVQRYPDGALTPIRMLRLGEMLLDRASDVGYAEYQVWKEEERRFDAGEIGTLREEPRLDYVDAITVLKQLIERFPGFEHLDAARYLLGYCYVDESSKQRDQEQAFATYKALVDSHPDSGYAPQAYLRLGEILFDENKFADSIPYYDRVMGYTGTTEYERALYKLAWAYYKIDDLDRAIPGFVQLLDLSEKREAEGGEQSDLKQESLRYLAIALAEQAEEKRFESIAYTDSFFSRDKDRPYRYEVLKQVAEILVTQARFEEAIAAYRGIQERYPLSPDNPDIHATLIGLYRKKQPPDEEGATRARAELTELYKPGTPWYEANRDNRDAIRLATRYIEESLEEVASDYHRRAQTTKLPQDYLAAATKYREYLDRFPYARNAYELRWQLAESLYFGGYYEDAISEYEKVLKYPDTTHRAAAIYAVAASYQRVVVTKQGDYKTLDGAAATRPFPEAGQKVEIAPIPLSDLDQRFIAAVDALEQAVPDKPELPGMLYLAAELYFYHNQFQEARARFQRLVDRHPSTDEAGFAAGLIVDSYQYEGDLAKVREVSGQLAARDLGKDPQLSAERKKLFAAKEKNALFAEARQLFEAGSHLAAADAFYAYYTRFPEAPQRDLALYNAAVGFEKNGETERARKLFEEMLDKFPDSEQSAPTFMKIADVYEKVLDLDRANHYYEQLLKTHPTNTRAPDALANSAFLYIGQKRFADAARAYERYERDHPQLPDAGSMLFRAAETWNTANQPKEALRVYQRYLTRYGPKDPSGALDAQVRIATLYEKLGNTKQARSERQKVVDLFLKEGARDPKRFDPAAVNAAAKAAFGFLQEEFARIETMKFTGDNTKDAKVLDSRAIAIKDLNARFESFVTTYPDFEWATAALYYMGYNYQRFADAIFEAPLPRDITAEEDKAMYRDEVLAKLAEPIETKAIELFERVVKEATDKRRNTPWVEKAREALHAVSPDSYPLFKNEGLRVKPSDPREIPPPAKETSQRDASSPGVRFADLGGEGRP